MNLENLVENRAKEGKTIILVGCFLETIYRSIAGTVLGKYFEKVAIFTIYEEMETVNKYIEKRENTFGNPGGTLLAKQISETSKQISFLKRVIDSQLFVLGFGADKSFIINNETKLY